MKRSARNFLLVVMACAAGFATSELCYRAAWTHDAFARLLGRESTTSETLIIAANFRRVAGGELTEPGDVERELNLLRHQFGSEKPFVAALKSSRISESGLRENIVEHLRALAWIERQITADLAVTEMECRRIYEQERAGFTQPQRYRASHLFLAAPEGTPLEMVEAKRTAMKTFAKRIGKGEPLAQLAAEASEDEATKLSGGDLGFFSEERALPEFVAELAKLRPGAISAPFQTPLGFHIAQLTEVRSLRELAFDDVRDEIASELRNAKRAAAVSRLAERLKAAEFGRPKS